MNIREHAQHYAELGLSVIPLCSPDHADCSPAHIARCRKPGKMPLVAWKRLQQVGTSPEIVARWFRRWPGANVGVICGPSHLVVVDADGADGAESLRPYRIPETPTAQSARGLRYHFRAPAAALSKREGLLPGVDLQSGPAVAVLPPSRHVTGAVYTWLIPVTTDFASCPDWVVDLAQHPHAGSPAVGHDWAALWRGVPQQRRNTTAARLAGRLLARGIAVDEVWEIMPAWNRNNRPPLDPKELDTIVVSIAQREAKAARRRDGGLLGTPWVEVLRHGDVTVYEALRAVESRRGYAPGSRLYVAYRELAEVSGYGIASVATGLRALERQRLIEFWPGRSGLESREAAEVRRVLPVPKPRWAASTN